MTKLSMRHALILIRGLPAVMRRYGVCRALRLAWSDLLFDLARGSDTSFETPPRGRESTREHPRHEACNPVLFGEAMAQLPLPVRDTVLLDLGAGKGRALMMAVERGIDVVIGVELSHALCDVARRNLTRLLLRRPMASVEITCADAATYVVPDHVNTIFLFNPFVGKALCGAVGGIAASLARNPRQVFVVYLYPRELDLFRSAGFSEIARRDEEFVVLEVP